MSIKSVAVGVSACLFMTSLAANASNNNVEQLEQKAQALQQQLDALQSQLNSLQNHKDKHSKHHQSLGSSDKAQAAQTRLAEHNQQIRGEHTLSANHGVAKAVEPIDSLDSGLASWVYTSGSPVVSSPYIGVHSQFNASDLIVNFPYINEDLRLLQQRQLLENRLLAADLSFPDKPLLDVSGKVEGIAMEGESYTNGNMSDIDLGSAEISVVAEMNQWVSGLIAFDYDNAAPLSSLSSRRIANSRIYLHRGFITVGNLNKTPFWFSMGQEFMPFGRYSSSMISSPLTLLLARTNGRGVIVGYHQSTDTSPYAELFGFRGDARTGNSSNVNQYGADLGYQFSGKDLSSDLGVSYINNMANSDGFQSTGGAIFGGFSSPTSSEVLVKRVPGVDLHGSLTLGNYTFLGEWDQALNNFNTANLTFNGKGAKPSALNVEGTYNFTFMDKPTSFALGYGQTNQALALRLPSKRYIAALNYAAWRDTILSLEFKHEKNYGASDTATGTNSTIINSISDPTIGKSSNTVTAQLGIYF